MPQVSVLSPLSFTNDIVTNDIDVEINGAMIKFADDKPTKGFRQWRTILID